MKRIKLLHIITSLKIGGAESLIVDFLESLDKDIFESEVIYFHYGPNVEKLKKMGITVYQVKGLLFKFDLFFFLNLFFLVRNIKPDCIHGGLWLANLMARFLSFLLRIPNVNTLHLPMDQDGQASFFRYFVDKLTLPLADRLIAVSDEVAVSQLKRSNWLNKNKVRVIKNGINCKKVINRAENNSKKREELGLSPLHFVIGTVGRFAERKNYSLLIESFALLSKKYKEIRLILVGIGSQEVLLKNMAYDLGVKDKIVFIVGEEAYGYYPLFDCFVLTSFKEGLSIALLEAMCFGIPCIVSDIDKKSEVILSGKNGIVIEAGKMDVLVESLDLLINNSNVRHRLGREGKKTVLNEFDFNRMIKKYTNIYLSLLEKDDNSSYYN